MSPRSAPEVPPWAGLGLRLKRARAAHYAETGRDITPADLAEAIERSEGTISLWVNGQSYPSIEQAYILAETLGVSAGWLVYGEGAMKAGHYPPAQPMPPESLVRVEVPPRKKAK